MAMHPGIMLAKRPAEYLSNFRWVAPMPDELNDLIWIEELLIAHAHVVGRVVRLQAHNPPSARYHAPPPCSSDDACVIA